MSFRGLNGKNPIVVGPWGGLGGDPWDDGVNSAVRQIIITHGAAIDSIKIEYDLEGNSFWSEKHGAGSGDSKTDQVKFNYPQEILTSISGCYGPVGTSVVIRSLTFETNCSKYGPFGTEQGTFFSLPVSSGRIVGFHGRSGSCLHSVGCHLNKEKITNLSNTPSALRSITRSYDKNGHRYADSNAGYDMVLAVRDRGDNYSVLTSSLPKEQYPSPSQDGTLWNKMVSIPSFYSDNGTMTISTPVRFGPWGGSSGTIFDDGIYTGVRQINLTRGLGISSMKVLYDRNGQAIWGDKRGASGGARPEKVIFDFPSEILTHITGYFGSTMIMGPTVIKSISFHTTKKTHGPFGDEHGTFFSSCLTDGRIVGFHGRAGWYIDSIGVHVLEGKVLSQRSDIAVTDAGPSRHNNSDMLALARSEIGDQVTFGVVKEPIPIGPGPWGGEGGKPWDDGVYTGVKQVYIMRTDFIGSIQIEYDRSGQSVWSTKHGNGGQITHRIKLDYPHEVLTCIYGYYNTCVEEGPRVLRSITFVSSRGKYGPFGEEMGTYFTSATTEGKVVGFHGRSSQYLDAIGVHMQHWLGDNKTSASNSKYYISKYLF